VGQTVVQRLPSLFISHDLSVARYFADRMPVM
jgi:ABC-type oligopeptide transport system ATPase subunit